MPPAPARSGLSRLARGLRPGGARLRRPAPRLLHAGPGPRGLSWGAGWGRHPIPVQPRRSR
eukprot:2895461-Lingulodinium_polyedra.AAC.1